MNTEDKKLFATMMYGVAENFGGQLTKDGLRLRFNALAEFTQP